MLRLSRVNLELWEEVFIIGKESIKLEKEVQNIDPNRWHPKILLYARGKNIKTPRSVQAFKIRIEFIYPEIYKIGVWKNADVRIAWIKKLYSSHKPKTYLIKWRYTYTVIWDG